MRENIRIIISFALICGALFVSPCNKDDERGKEITPTDTSAVSSEEVSSVEENGCRLTLEDYTVMGVSLGMTPEEVSAVLGNPGRQAYSKTDGL